MQARVVLVGETDAKLAELYSESIHEAIGENYHVGILTGCSADQLAALAEENVVDMLLLNLTGFSVGKAESSVESVKRACRLLTSLKIVSQKPVIAVASSEDYKAMAFEAGADKFLSLPLEPAVFQHEIRSLLAAGDC